MATDVNDPTHVVPGRAAAAAKRDRVRIVLKVFGILCLVGAVAVGGYLAWLMWGTSLTTNAAQAELRRDFAGGISSKPPSHPSATKVRLPGEAVAQIVIPRMDLDMIVVEGIDTVSLTKGPGHYPDTADPWDKHGRVGIAGHRTTYAAPFWDLEKLRDGDEIILKTEYGIFTYAVTRSFVTTPYNGGVLEQTREPTLVLTTCNPKFSAAQRLIVIAERVEALWAK